MASEEEGDFTGWEPFERDKELWVKFPDGQQACFGNHAKACDKWADYLAKVDFGFATDS